MKLYSILFTSAFAREHYHGDKVFRLKIDSQEKLDFFNSFSSSLDIWKEPRNFEDFADVRVPRNELDGFEVLLKSRRISSEIFIKNVEDLVKESLRGVAQPFNNFNDFDYEQYHRFDDYQEWQRQFSQINADIVEIEDLGDSFEGRALNSMKIGKGSHHIVLHGGTHAREWISPITMVNFAKQLVDEYRAGGLKAKYLTDITWHIVINMNPDGYEYTFDSSRMWRKTRSTNNTPNTCIGVDPNRNWDACWQCPGASNNPCNEAYYGPSAFSEPETKAASDHLKSLSNVRAYVDVHAYGQYWMYPYGYKIQHSQSNLKLNTISMDAAIAIALVHRKQFKYGTIHDVIYQASGSSADWAYDEANIPCSFALELRDQGQFGFLLPANQIKPVAEEMWAGLTVMADAVIAGTCNRK